MLKRGAVKELLEVREANRPRLEVRPVKPAAYPEKRLTFTGNVLNEKARAFYEKCGVTEIASAAETGQDLSGETVMTTKYCLRLQLGLCKGYAAENAAEPLILVDEDGREFKVNFRCGDCGMELTMSND